MTRYQLLVLTAMVTAAMTANASAQSTRMTVRPDSKVTLAGSSNVHDWACNSGTLNATIELDSAYESPFTSVARPITRVVVTIPAKSLKCGHGKMDDNMYKALRAQEFTDIHYTLESYEVDKERTTAETFVAKTVGDLTVAGTTRKVEIPITAERLVGGAMKGEGVAKLLMTDFGIKPPVALLGTLRTKNEIEVRFQVLLDKAAVVALSQP
ncbi:MAG TPA: YceI family protein [Gemmatimonadaceae bacterium]|nr:YceI family protein [Gemmatimonadaceae bacterium]